MFEELQLCSWAVAHHLSATFAEERARYLTYFAERGDSLLTLTAKANKLIHVARQLSLCPDVGAAVKRLSADQGRRDRSVTWTEARSALGSDEVLDRYASVVPLSGLVA